MEHHFWWETETRCLFAVQSSPLASWCTCWRATAPVFCSSPHPPTSIHIFDHRTCEGMFDHYNSPWRYHRLDWCDWKSRQHARQSSHTNLRLWGNKNSIIYLGYSFANILKNNKAVRECRWTLNTGLRTKCSSDIGNCQTNKGRNWSREVWCQW